MSKKHLISELAEISAKATADATAAERSRISCIFQTCRGSNALPLLDHFILSGASEAQACARIQDALAAQSDEQEICSRISFSANAEKKPSMPSAAAVYDRMNKAEGSVDPEKK